MISIREHRLAISFVVSIGLLVLGASLDSPRWWLILPGWTVLGICIAVWFTEIPSGSPYKSAFALPAMFSLFYFALWEGAFRTLLTLLFKPSADSLYYFLTNRGFLVLTIIYLVAVCINYSMKVDKLRDQLERLRSGPKEKQDIP